jgi:hypothetical protein
MKTAMDYLDDLKEKLGSDYKIAKAFEVDTAAVSMIRKRGKISDDVAIKIADLLGAPREEVLIAAAIARSEGEVKDSWVKLYKNVSRAAVMILAISLFGYKSDAYANTGHSKELSVIYIMRSLRYHFKESTLKRLAPVGVTAGTPKKSIKAVDNKKQFISVRKARSPLLRRVSVPGFAQGSFPAISDRKSAGRMARLPVSRWQPKRHRTKPAYPGSTARHLPS